MKKLLTKKNQIIKLEEEYLKKIYDSVDKDRKILNDFKSELKKINSKREIEDSIRILK